MRQLILQMGVTLDGYVAGTGSEGDWGLPDEDPDVRAWKVASLGKALPAAEWAGSRIARGDLTEEITALKSEPGGEIMVHGGAAFVQALSRLGLIDEYRLVIMPVALGSGLPLFKDLPRALRLDLAEAKTFPDGTTIHVYRPITASR